jgi:hypothetical protein
MESSNRFRPQLESLDERLPPSSIHSAQDELTNSTPDTTTPAKVDTPDVVIFKFPHGKRWV